MYMHFAWEISFEIQLISKEIGLAEQEYTNKHPINAQVMPL